MLTIVESLRNILLDQQTIETRGKRNTSSNVATPVHDPAPEQRVRSLCTHANNASGTKGCRGINGAPNAAKNYYQTCPTSPSPTT